jgi:DNA replication protein DnaC
VPAGPLPRASGPCAVDPWTLADFDYTAQPGVDETLIRELATLRCVDQGSNVLFVGPPGVGKTMLAVGLARAAAKAGHRVYFTTAADLAACCHKAAIEGRWARALLRQPETVGDRRAGLLPSAADAASALFQVINTRYATSAATAITTKR